MRKKRDPSDVSPLVREMLAGMDSVVAAMQAGEPIEKFAVRTATLDLEPRAYGPDAVKAVRAKLRASQELLAQFLGVGVQTLRSWERGTRPVPRIAARFLDEIDADPNIWNRRVHPVPK